MNKSLSIELALFGLVFAQRQPTWTNHLVALLIVSCTGNLDLEGKTPTAGPSERPPAQSPDEVTVDPLDKVQAKSCTAPVADAPLRRLSRVEYLATFDALFSKLDVAQPTLLDDPSEHGFENRASHLNPIFQLLEQYGGSAAEVGVAIANDLASFVDCDPEAPADPAACGRSFIEHFGGRAFRRPLTHDELSDYASYFETELDSSDFASAIQMTVEVLLQSPQFLYRLELGDTETLEEGSIQLTADEVAIRMAYMLTGAPPDATLLASADSGSLLQPSEREIQARRLLADPAAATMMVEFHRQWLDLDRLYEEPKDAARYPEYDEALMKSIREESDRFVRQVFWEGDATLASFLTSTRAPVNTDLASLYGVDPPSDGWHTVELNPTQRAGFLTRANFLAARAHKLEGSPPLRSVAILEDFFCLTPPTPPADADLSEPAQSPDAEPRTNRELFEQRIEPTACKGCHSQFDTIGYGLEHYDAIGAYRDQDNGFAVDANGEIKLTDVNGAFVGGVELSERIAGSETARGCVSKTWFEYLLGRELEAADQCRLGKLNLALDENGGDLRELLIALVSSSEFIYRTTEGLNL